MKRACIVASPSYLARLAGFERALDSAPMILY